MSELVMGRSSASKSTMPFACVGLLLCAFMMPTLACNKASDESSSQSAVSPLPKAEAERGMQACQVYVARVCSCAETHSEFEETCTLAKALPQAFQLNLDLSATPGLTGAEQSAVKVEARKIAAACFEDAAKLDEKVCPRLAPASP